MIRLTDPSGAAIYLATAAIAEVHETGPSSQWHGIRSVIKTFDGRTLEAQERASEIAESLGRAALRAAQEGDGR